MNKKRIKIAIQKSGRLADHSSDLLKKCGLVVSRNKGQLIGYFGNNIFPFRAGELIKAYYIGNKYINPYGYYFKK